MPFRREDRPNWYFQARIRGGWKQLSAGTPDRRLALKIEAMWHDLAHEERAWDVLAPVLGGDMKVGELFDLYRDAAGKVPAVRRLLNDTNLEPLVAEYLGVHSPNVTADSLAHIEFHLRALIPAGASYPRSHATIDNLTQALAKYGKDNGVKPGTLRKVHSSWSGFFTYLTNVKRMFDRNPLEVVSRPAQRKPSPRFYDFDVVERIVGYQPTPERRAYMALAYGTPTEPSIAVALTRADVFPEDREIRAAGTKAHTRDRMIRMTAWSWPVLWDYARDLLPSAKLWPGWSRYTVSDWHRETVKALNLETEYPLYNARHHWAVTHLRAGVPVAVVQQALGHASAKHTLDTYGLWVPDGTDRAAADNNLAAHETRRRSAARSAKPAV